jgi:hypothetical protein
MIKLLILISLLSITSCSIVEVHTKDDVKIYRKFGFVNIVELPSSGSYVDLNFSGIGYVDDDLVLGYKGSKKTTMQGDGCLIFVDKKSSIKHSILEYLKEINCNFIYVEGENNDD